VVQARFGCKHSEVVAGGAAGVHEARLEHHAHPTGRGIELGEAPAADQGPAARWGDEAEQRPQQRRLARAVGAEQTHHTAGLDFEAHAVESADRAEVLGQCVNADVEHAGDSFRRCEAHGIATSVTSIAVERSATKNGSSSRASSAEGAWTSHQIACPPERQEAKVALWRSGLR
jgi:hypothetical protein